MKRTIAYILIIVASATLWPSQLVAADSRTTAEAHWQEGIAAYENRNYDAAIDSFRQIVLLGEASADVYYNLANAYFKRGQQPTLSRPFSGGELGNAVLNYHRALKLNPAMEDARYNLELAVDHTNDTDGVPQSFISTLWHGLRNAMTTNGWTITSIVMLACALTLVMIYLLSERIAVRKVCFFSALVIALGFAVSTLLATSSHYAAINDNRAVVQCSDTTPVHASPDSASKIIRQPSQGVTVRISRNHGEWSEIIFADGEKGWIRSSAVEMV